MPKKSSKPQNKAIDKTHERALKTVARGAGIAFVGLVLGKLFAYLTRVFIARNMGPEAYGLISIGIAIISIVTIFSLIGLEQGLIRFIAFYRGKKDLRRVKGSIISSFKIALPISIFFSIILFTLSEQIALFFSKPDLIPIIQIFSLVLPFSVIMTLSHSSLIGFKMIKQKVYTVEIGKNLSTLLVVLTLFYLGFNLLGAVLAFGFGFVLSSLTGLYYLKNKILSRFKKIKPIFVGKEIISFSYPLLIAAVLLLIMSWTDVLFLGYFDTSANVGIYSAALNTCILLTFVLESFGFIFMPLISELHSQSKKEEIRKIYKSSTRWMFSIVFPIFLLFIFFPDKILNILFGENFISGSQSLMVLAFGSLIVVSVGVTGRTITAIGKTKINFYLTSMGATLNIILNLILIPIYGIVGAAVATTSSLVLWNLLSLIYLHRKMKIQPYDKNYLKPFFSSLISMGIIYFVLKNLPKPISLSILMISFIVFMFSYSFVLLIIKGFSKEDVIILKAIERKTGLKIEWLRNLIKNFI